MKLKWLGHAAFVIESSGPKILIDPFGENVPYPGIDETAHVVALSHEHDDHNAVHLVRGDFQVLRALDERTGKARRIKKEIEGVAFRSVPSFHDDKKGTLRGENGIFVIDADGLTLAHLGDLGEKLTPSQVTEIGDVDLLFIPVGGYYTIDAAVAKEVVGQVNPRIVVPMHYKTKYIESWPIATADGFLDGMDNVLHLDRSEATVEKGSLPDRAEVWVFKV